MVADAPVSGSVKIEEEIRSNEPIATNIDMTIDEILANSKKRCHRPKYVIRPIPKLELEDTYDEPTKHDSVLVHIFKYLTRKDLKNCALVCKDWFTASINPVLHRRMDLSESKITHDLKNCEYN